MSLLQLQTQEFSKNTSFHKGPNIPAHCLQTELNLLILLKLWIFKYRAKRKFVNLLTETQKPFADLMFLVAQLHLALKLDLLCVIYYEVIHMYNKQFYN